MTQTYTPLGQIADIALDGGSVASYQYNPVGATTAKTYENGLSALYRYDAAARLQAMRGTVPVTYSLNAVGQRTGRHDAAFGPESYAYDAIDQVIGANYGGVRSEGFAYDAMGNRQSASDTAAGITAYTVRADNTYATGESVPVSLFGNRFLFTGRDHRRLGSLGGDCRRQPVGRDEQERVSQLLSEIGLYDYRNRVYSAELGRFLQTDPIRFSAGDGNLYRYVGNNPINLWDPYGLYGFMDFIYDASSFSAGVGDALTFGLTDQIREMNGWNDAVEKCSTAYGSGQITGTGLGLSLAGAGIAVNAPRIAAGITAATEAAELGATYLIAAGVVTAKEAALRPDLTLQASQAITEFALGNGAGGLPPPSAAGIAGGVTDAMGFHLNPQ